MWILLVILASAVSVLAQPATAGNTTKTGSRYCNQQDLVLSNSGNGSCIYPDDVGPVRTPLMVAIWRGNIEEVKTQTSSASKLDAAIPLDCNKKLLTSPLLNAIDAGSSSRFRQRSQAMLEYLLENGADPNFAPGGITPLQMAASLGDLPVDVVKTLIRHGARVNDRDKNGESALLISAQRENGRTVMQELLAAGADIRVVNELGDNALMLAAWQHYPDNVKLLMQSGAEVCATNNEGQTAIDLAKLNLNNDPGKQEIISFLREKCGS